MSPYDGPTPIASIPDVIIDEPVNPVVGNAVHIEMCLRIFGDSLKPTRRQGLKHFVSMTALRRGLREWYGKGGKNDERS